MNVRRNPPGDYLCNMSYMNESRFDISVFLRDVIQTIRNPRVFFSGISKEGGMGEPILRAILYGILTAFIGLVLGFFKMVFLNGTFFGTAFLGMASFIFFPIVAFFGLFIGTIFLLIISALVSGNTQFDMNARVCAALMVIYPLNALGQAATLVNFSLGVVVALGLGFYGLWLFYQGLVSGLNAKPTASKIIVGLFAFFLLFFSYGSFVLVRSAKNFPATIQEKIKKDLPQYKIEIKKETGSSLAEDSEFDADLKLNLEEASKQMNSALAEINKQEIPKKIGMALSDIIRQLFQASTEIEKAIKDNSTRSDPKTP